MQTIEAHKIRVLEKLWRWFSDVRVTMRRIYGRRKTSNGGKINLRFGEVFEKYTEQRLASMSELTRKKFTERTQKSMLSIWDERIADLNSVRVSRYISDLKDSTLSVAPSRKRGRQSFKKELCDLRCVLSWWSDHYDLSFQNPVKPHHFRASIVAEKKNRNTQVDLKDLKKFLSCLSGIVADMAMLQFYCGARIGEIAGLQKKNVDLKKRIITICEVVTWVKGRPTIRPLPKNGCRREVYINDTLFEILSRYNKNPHASAFIFHDQGAPLRYARIVSAYNKAWIKAGYDGIFSGTHLLRYAASQTARRVSGSCEAAGSITGHKSIAMIEKYSKTSDATLNRLTVKKMERYMSGASGIPLTKQTA